MRPWKTRIQRLGKLQLAFCIALILDLILLAAAPASEFTSLIQFVTGCLGLWLLLRLIRVGVRRAIWGLRNRLLVTYLFIAVVPVLLIIVLAGLGGFAVLSQFAVYLAVSNLDRKTAILRDVAENIAAAEPKVRPEVMARLAQMHGSAFPNLLIIAKSDSGVQRWPADQPAAPPPDGWKQVSGVTVRGGRYLLWAHAVSGSTGVTAVMPLSRRYLSELVPGLGDVTLLDIGKSKGAAYIESGGSQTYVKSSHEPPSAPLPKPYNQFDIDVQWLSTIPVWRWSEPEKKDYTLLVVHTRPSAVLGIIFNTKVDQFGQFLPIALLVVSILFLIVELVALVIGVSLTHSITRAVSCLYQGTQRVIQGDFSSRIPIYGKDQLAELGSSFNSMTENLERLLAVAKEKERLQAELQIAREVQEQLYPKVTPALRTLKLMAICQPARMVSGDYYDYLCLPDGRLALAFGDVAGKGISAALLMATIQSAMRMELRTSRAMAAPAAGGQLVSLPTSSMVSDLNQQLHATTSPEKYATFFFALYNEDTGELHYTNAGHLPPLLVRNGSAVRLEVSGTVVGAFPLARYEDNRVQLESGDLLVCYTDGITEPENEYGEEFGEERLVDVVTKNVEQSEAKIVSSILEAVHQWTSAAEQPDDMTLLLVRKL